MRFIIALLLFGCTAHSLQPLMYVGPTKLMTFMYREEMGYLIITPRVAQIIWTDEDHNVTAIDTKKQVEGYREIPRDPYQYPLLYDIEKLINEIYKAQQQGQHRRL